MTRWIAAAFFLLLSAPSQAKVYNWISVSDPTFSGLIYRLSCTATFRSAIHTGNGGIAAPLERWTFNPFILKVDERTISFTGQGEPGPAINVDIEASRLEGTYDKMLRITWRQKEGLSGVIVSINGEANGSFTSTYALTIPGIPDTAFRELNYGTCISGAN
jgi:hypothetical protein